MFSTFSRRIGAAAVTLLIIGGSFWGGIFYATHNDLVVRDTTQNVFNKTEGAVDNVDFAPFWKAWNILNEKYVATKEEKNISEQDKVWGAIQGLAQAYGDPYTVFFPPVEAKEFQNEISGNFEGVGMEVDVKDGVVTVITPLKNSPAEKAGVRAGDKVLKIDDTITASLTIEDAVRLMRGKRGTEVRLTLLSEKEKQPREVKIIRDTINIPTIETVKRPDGVFVIRLYNFSESSATYFRNALEEFVKSKSNKLIIDLRGNPGGYLDAAVDMASWFLPADKVIVKEDSGGKGEDSSFESKGYNIFNSNLKMIILVDGGSASASEILAGALREHGIAKIVGTKTYGKGSVQQLVPVTSDTSLKITIARWLTPNGVSISENGLTPDTVVEFTAEDIQNKNDAQLNKAVELLLAQ